MQELSQIILNPRPRANFKFYFEAFDENCGFLIVECQ